MMKFIVFQILIISIISSCGLTTHEVHKIKVKCETDYSIDISPPKFTYKYEVKLKSICKQSGEIIIKMDGKEFDRLQLNNNGTLIKGDWYGNNFGLEYVTKNLNGDTINEMLLEVVFSENRSGFNKTIKH